MRSGPRSNAASTTGLLCPLTERAQRKRVGQIADACRGEWITHAGTETGQTAGTAEEAGLVSIQTRL